MYDKAQKYERAYLVFLKEECNLAGRSCCKVSLFFQERFSSDDGF